MRRAGAAAVLLAAILVTPLVPSPHLPLDTRRELYAGPDLLSDAPVRDTVVREGWPVPFLVRDRMVRTTQDGTLLREVHRRSVRLPLPLLAAVLLLVWLERRRRRGSGAPG